MIDMNISRATSFPRPGFARERAAKRAARRPCFNVSWRPCLVAACGAAAITLAPLEAALAQTSTPQAMSDAKSSAVAPADVTFMHKAVSGGATEVELGKLAQAKSGAAAQTKSFGTMMVQDHTKAANELKDLAAAKGVPLPDAPDTKQRAQIDAIGKLDGKAFDAAFKKQMVADHQSTVADFQKASKSARDNDVKAWAQKTLPTLQEHLKMAQELLG
jgi:putative membrane protein